MQTDDESCTERVIAAFLHWCRHREVLPLFSAEDLALWARQSPRLFAAAVADYFAPSGYEELLVTRQANPVCGPVPRPRSCALAEPSSDRAATRLVMRAMLHLIPTTFPRRARED
jgi:hypothetical protein